MPKEVKVRMKMSMDSKIDRINSKLGQMEKHLAVYNSQLKEHIKRTEMLEAKLVPLEKFQYKAAGALALLSIVAIIASILEIVLRFSHIS